MSNVTREQADALGALDDLLECISAVSSEDSERFNARVRHLRAFIEAAPEKGGGEPRMFPIMGWRRRDRGPACGFMGRPPRSPCRHYQRDGGAGGEGTDPAPPHSLPEATPPAATGEVTEERGWLIERKDTPGGNLKGEWLSHRLSPRREQPDGTARYVYEWTRDASKAIRFSRGEDAIAAAGIILDGPAWGVSEHIWSDK